MTSGRAALGFLLLLAASLLSSPLISLAMLSRDYGETFIPLPLLRGCAAVVVVVTLLLPAAYIGAMALLAPHRHVLARWFPPLLRVMLLLLGLLLIAQGVLAALTSAAVFRLDAQQDPQSPLLTLSEAGIVILLAIAVGLVISGFMTLEECLWAYEVPPIDIAGRIVEEGSMPQLQGRVQDLAARLQAPPPAQIVVGLFPLPFVTGFPLRLQGQGVRTSGETLYLPLATLHALSAAELDAVIGHELAHFRGQDLPLLTRLAPAALLLQRTGENVLPSGNSAVSLGRLPAMMAVAGMLAVLGRATGSILQRREFEADQAGARVASGTVVITAITKLAFLADCWRPFHRIYGRLAHKGIARRNLVADFLAGVRATASAVPRERIIQRLLRNRQAHPFDSHPTVAERAAAVGVAPEAAVLSAIEALVHAQHLPGEAQAIEEAVTAEEMALACLPGRTLTLHEEPLYREAAPSKPEGTA